MSKSAKCKICKCFLQSNDWAVNLYPGYAHRDCAKRINEGWVLQQLSKSQIIKIQKYLLSNA